MDEENLELNVVGDDSYSNHLRAQENVKAWRQNQVPQVPDIQAQGLSAQSQAYLDMVRLKSDAGLYNPILKPTEQSVTGALISSTQDNRPSFVSYNTDISDVYETLNSGKLHSRYDSYISGIDNNERLAKQQSTSEVWGRGLKRFGTQVGTSFFGNLAALPVGISEWINTGNFEATYDNDFTRMLDDIDRKGQLNNNIYYSREEEAKSLWQGLGTSRFWADKVLGGASFTVGMLLSEGLIAAATGGSSLSSTGARFTATLSRVALARAISKGNTLVARTAKNASTINSTIVGSQGIQSSMKWANYGKKSAEVLNDIRFVLTSTGYEAGMEARHFRKDAEDQFYSYYEGLGISPTQADVSAFRDELDNNSNKVFTANTAILGVSNMALFGRMFGVGNTLKWASAPVGKFLNKKVFNIGTKEVSPGVFKELNRKTYHKVLSGSWNGLIKPTFSEGFWEEGGQGVASTMMAEYLQSTYDPRIAKEVSSYTDAFFNSLATQYGEKAGQEEVLIGAIIGVAFGGLGGAFVRGGREAKRQVRVAEQETQVAQAPAIIAEALYTQENLLSQIGAANRNMRLEESIEEDNKKGNTVDSTLKSEAMIISSLQAAHEIGKDGSFIEVLTGTIEGMDSTRLMEEYGLESPDQVAEFKANKIEALNRLNKQYTNNRSIAETYIGRGTMPKSFRGKEGFLVDALAYSLTMNQTSERIGYDAINSITEIFDSLKDTKSSETIQALGMFAMSDEENRSNYQTYQKEYKVVREMLEETSAKLRDLQRKDKAEGLLNEIDAVEKELKELHERSYELESLLEGLHTTMESKFFEEIREIGTVSREALENLEENMKRSDRAISALEEISPDLYMRVTSHFDSLNRAVEYSREFSEINKVLLSGKFNTKMTNNIFGNLLSSSKTLNDETFETLIRISEVYTRDNKDGFVSNDSVLTLEEWAEFQKTGEVADETLQSISDKIVAQKVLTTEEKAIYEASKEEVDALGLEKRVQSIADKIRSKQSLTAVERIYYRENFDEVEANLNDPLNNAVGEKIIPTEDLSPEAKRFAKFMGENISKEGMAEKLADKAIELVETSNITVEDAIIILERFELQETPQYNELLLIQRQPGKQAQLRKVRAQIREIFRTDRMKKYFPDGVQGLIEFSDEVLSEYLSLVEKQRTNNSLTKAERRRLWELRNSEILTESEFQEYDELVEKSKQGGLKLKELARLEEIEDSFEQYNALQGTVYEGASVADLLRLLNQLENEIGIESLKTEDLTEAEYVEIVSTEVKVREVAEAERQGKISQVTEYVLSRFVKGGVQLHHIQLDVLIDRILKLHPNAIIRVDGNILGIDTKFFNGISGTVVTVELEDGSEHTLAIPVVKGKKGKRVGNPITVTSNNPKADLESLLGMRAISVEGQKGNYYLVYNVGEEVSPIRASSDFIISNETGLFFDEEAARQVQPGDKVELVFDYTDSYNKTLKPTALVKEANIYIVKGGKIIGRLKSSVGISNADGLHEARTAAVTKGKVVVTVESVLSGIPIIQTNEDGSKKVTPINQSDVIAQGYIEDGVSNITLPDGTTTRFIESASKIFRGRRVPFVVIRDRLSGKPIAFPAEVKNREGNIYSTAIVEALNNPNLSDIDKVIAINNILLSSGINTEEFWMTLDNINDTALIDEIQNELVIAETSVDLDNFTNDIEAFEVGTIVDFEQNTMTPPKVVLNFDNITEATQETKAQPKMPTQPAVNKRAARKANKRQRIKKRNKPSPTPQKEANKEVQKVIKQERTSEQQGQSVEQQKAGIKRRWQEELSNIGKKDVVLNFNKPVEFISTAGTFYTTSVKYTGEVTEEGTKSKLKTKLADTSYKLPKTYHFTQADNKYITLTISEEKLLKEINAKYEEEIDALETQATETQKAEIVQTNKPTIQTIGNVTFGTANKQGQTDNNEDAVYVDAESGIFILADGMGGEGMITHSPSQTSQSVINKLLGKPDKNATELLYDEYLRNKNITSDEAIAFLNKNGFNIKGVGKSMVSTIINSFKTRGDLTNRKGFRTGATALKAEKVGKNTYEIEKVGDTVYFVVDKNGKITQTHGLSDVATTQGYMFSVRDGKPYVSTPKIDSFTVTLNEGETLVLATDFIETDKAIQDFIDSGFGKNLNFEKFQKNNKQDDSTFITIRYDAELESLNNQATSEQQKQKALEVYSQHLKQEGPTNKVSYRLPIGGGVQYGTLLENGNVLNEKGEELYASVLRDVTLLDIDPNTKLADSSNEASKKCK